MRILFLILISFSSFAQTLGVMAGNSAIQLSTPVISGDAYSGQVLTAKGNSPHYIYQWKRDGVNISSANSKTYTLTDTDAGSLITCSVTLNSETLTSEPVLVSWWIMNGISPSDVVAAYQGVAARNYIQSRINLADPGNDDLAQLASAPDWSASNGWSSAGETAKGLISSALLHNTNHSIMIRIVDQANDSDAMGFAANSFTEQFSIRSRPSVTTVQSRFGAGTISKSATTLTSGTIAVSNNRLYINGVEYTGSTGTPANASSIYGILGLYLGNQNSFSVPLSGKVYCVAHWASQRTSAQIAVAHTAMMKLSSTSVPVNWYPADVNKYSITDLSATTITTADGTYDWKGRPSIEESSPGVYMLIYFATTSHAIMAGSLYCKFTDDGGLTWSAENKYLDGSNVTGFPMRPTGATSIEGPGEPYLYKMPNGDLAVHMWFGSNDQSSLHGSQQSKSTDGGRTWSAPATINFVGMSAPESSRSISTDDSFTDGTTVYGGIRQYTDLTLQTYRSGLIKTTDNGTTWELVSYLSTFSDKVIEYGMKKNTDGNIVAIHRNEETFNRVKRNISSDNGATWTPLENVNIPPSGRHRIFKVRDLTGNDYYPDDLWLMLGFHKTTGRIQSVWISPDGGVNWSNGYALDIEGTDAGYSDMFYDSIHNQFVVVGYYTNSPGREDADLVMYRFNITGI